MWQKAKLEFTPLEFETYILDASVSSGVLEFTPLEFETIVIYILV